MEKTVLTPEELSKLQGIEDKRGELVERFGIIEINIQDLKLQKELIIKDKEVFKKSKNFLKEFWKKMKEDIHLKKKKY